MIKQTHTFVELEVSAVAYKEIHDKLKDAGYDHVFTTVSKRGERGLHIALDMHGIAIVLDENENDRLVELAKANIFLKEFLEWEKKYPDEPYRDWPGLVRTIKTIIK